MRVNDPTARSLALLSMLQTHRHWKGSELARRLGVTERTVRRDVDRLRELGYRVDAVAGVDGGYRLAVGSHIPPLLLDDDEATALVVGLQRAAASAIEGIEETTVALMAKLEPVLPDRVRRRVDALRASVDVMVWSPPGETVPTSTLTALSQGCRDGEEVRFDYRRRDGEDSRRLVQPHQLVSVGRRWYLVAWDVRRDDWRTFRLDRMTEPTPAGSRFERRALPGGDAAEFVARGLREVVAEHEATVIVLSAVDDASAVGRRFGAKVHEVDAEHTRLELSADSEDWLASMIAILATRLDLVDVEAPPTVLAMLDAAAGRLERTAGTS